MKLQKIMFEIAKWSDDTFGKNQRNPAILHHLKKEVPELIEAIEKYQKANTIQTPYKESIKLQKNVMEEYADCFMLLLDSAHHFGLSAGVLLRHTREKLEINKQRKWGTPDENGVVEHLKT